MINAENLLILLSIGHFGLFLWFCNLWVNNSQIQRHQRAIEDARHEAIVIRLDAIFAKLLEGRS